MDILDDGNFRIATAHLPARRIPNVIPNQSTVYLIEQDYVQNFADFTPLALNTLHPTEANFRLVEETPLEDFGGGVAKWTRVFAKVPATWSELATLSYSFVGYLGTTGLDAAGLFGGRERFSRNVNAKVTRDYFLVGVGGSYASELNIPMIALTLYLSPGYGLSNPSDTDFIGLAAAYSPPFTPSRETYEGWVAADAAGASSFHIVARSIIQRWRGNIWCREVHYVKAL